MTRAELAKNHFLGGMNCAQAVALAFAETCGADLETVRAMTLPMGGGIGRLRETCGAVSGAAMSLGLLFPNLQKSESYALVQRFAERFRAENGSLNCGELLRGAGVRTDSSPAAEARTESYYRKRPCAELVECAAAIVEEILAEERGK